MKRWLVGLLLLVGPPALAQQAVPSIEFNSVPNPLHLPTNMYFGEVSGVSLNAKGHIFVLSRGNTSGPAYAAAATQLLEFDAKGQFVREIGKNLYAWSFGHTVKIDAQDNIWVTDKGSDMVIKFDPEGRIDKRSVDGKVLGVLGESGKQLKQFGWIHAMACPSENLLYVAELLNWRVQKLILHPQ